MLLAKENVQSMLTGVVVVLEFSFCYKNALG